MRDFSFCPICGEELSAREEGGIRRPFCENCGFVHYRNPSPAAGVLVREDEKVLLVQRRYAPFKGMWVIPSGYIEYGESPAETAVRELKEETGVDVELEGIHSVEPCFDDPRGDTIFILYSGYIKGGRLAPGDDASDARFFSLRDLPPIAFDVQNLILGRLQSEQAG